MKAAGRAALAAALAVAAVPASAQEPAPESEPAQSEPLAWEFEASVYGYFVPEDKDFGQPTVVADRGALHLEARYNYEDIETGSAWVGWNVGAGDALRLDATLMVGGVFGELTGVAPGYELSVTWKSLELYSEGEWVFDTSNSDNDFFYTWSQLAWSPWDWLTVGFAAQRTRAYETGLDIQRGPFVGFTYKSVTLTTYVFNGDEQPPTVVAALSVAF
jgi:hypothetical protein